MSGIAEVGQGKVTLELPEAKRGRSEGGFQDYLKECIAGVDGLQKAADQAASEIASGKIDNVHQAMIAMEKADVSFRLMVEARNRIVKAYEEIIKMQV
ncbi:MAG: flagellar hook-basal body complex protein FliE [bacterium]